MKQDVGEESHSDDNIGCYRDESDLPSNSIKTLTSERLLELANDWNYRHDKFGLRFTFMVGTTYLNCHRSISSYG